MLFYWCVFTTTDKPNTYLDMCGISYKSMKRQNSITKDDTVLLLCDAITAKRAELIDCFKDVKLVIVPQPKTVFEGAFLRYRLPEFYPLENGQECCYLDCDMVCVKGFRVKVPPSILLAYPEGAPTDSNYCGDRPLPLPYGCSSTFFAFSYSPLIKSILYSVTQNVSKQYYTLDQPYYNRTLNIFQHNVRYFPNNLISFNGHNTTPSTIFVNLCGEPGNADFHWTKMVRMIDDTLFE